MKRAVRLSDAILSGRSPEIPNDSMIELAVDYLLSLESGEPAPVLQSRVSFALELRGDADLRLAVEARLLAGSSVADVAAMSGVGPRVLHDYATLLFDVADNLSARSWITANAIDWHPVSGADLPNATRDATGRFVRHQSYFYGPFVCEHLLAALPELSNSIDLTTDRGIELEKIRLVIDAEEIRCNAPDSLAALLSQFPDTVADLPTREPTLGDVMHQRIASARTNLQDVELEAHQIRPIANWIADREHRVAG